MSKRSVDLPRRSCLSVPGSNPRFVEKAPSVPADMTFVDLEDSVAPDLKSSSRAAACEAVRTLAWDDRVLAVRVNGWRSPWTYEDVIGVVGGAGERLDEVVLPKVESAAEVVALDLLLTQVELGNGLSAGHTGIEVQIESARGLANVEEICAASPRLEAVVFGPADFAASLGMPMSEDGDGDETADRFRYALSRIVVAARAAGIQAIDGPFLKVRDRAGFRRSCESVRRLGYDGKWALHPDQVGILKEVFSPSRAEYDRANELLALYGRATREDGRGAVMFGDEMIDEASRKIALKVVARGSRAGLGPGAPGGA